MSLKLGMYELFGRIIPGAFYLVVFVQLGALLGLYQLDIQTLGQLSVITTLILGVIAYVLGTAFNLLSILWIRLFKPKEPLLNAFEKFRKKYPSWHLHFQAGDLHVLLAYIRRQNLSLADDVIERQNAFSLMLRNISLALIFLSIEQIACLVTTGNYIYIMLAILFIIISLLLIREARYFQGLFYSTIFETIMSYQLNMDDLIEKPKISKSEHEFISSSR